MNDEPQRQIAICVPDNCGRLIGKRQPSERLAEALADGMPMPNFHLATGLENRPLPGLDVTGPHTGFRNGVLRPDEDSRFTVPGEPTTDYYLSDAYAADGRLVEEAPRAILKRQLDRLAAAGLRATMASELEFYLFDQPTSQIAAKGYRSFRPYHHRHGDNDLLVTGIAREFLELITRDLAAAGITVDQIQGEGGVGQLEVNVRAAGPLRACDQHAIFKHIVKVRAAAMGRSVTFMAKPFENEPGSGGHIHLCLQAADGRTLCKAGERPGGDAAAFIAGILAFTPDFTLLHAPYANSYRRLRKGSFTPLNGSWAWENRSCLVRLTGGGSSARLEFRLPGADANPYFSYSGLLAAGLCGVQQGIELPDPVDGDAGAADLPGLPRDLTEALATFRQSVVAQDALTPKVHHHLQRLASEELEIERTHVTDWDLRRCFECA